MYRYIILISLLLIISCIYIVTFKNNYGNVQTNAIQLQLIGNITFKSNDTPRKFDVKNFHVPKFMLELYENNVKYNRMNYSFPEVVRSVIPKSADIFHGYEQFDEYQDNHLLTFDVPSCNDDEIFLSAELKILTLVDATTTAILKGIERLIKISVYDDVTETYLFVDKLQLYNTNNTWITFNLTHPVHDIIKRSPSNNCLKIVISIKHFIKHFEKSNSFRLSLMPINENHEHNYPVLLLSYDIIQNSKDKNLSIARRFKRNLEDDYEEETNHIWDDDSYKKEQMKKLKRNRSGCKRKPLYVNFSEIEYDTWIVQPRGYEAYQCQGKCFYPVAEHLSPTKHAIVQALLHAVSPGKASRSCCVPTKLGSISVLYVDHNGILTYRFAYQDMVVAECGCR